MLPRTTAIEGSATLSSATSDQLIPCTGWRPCDMGADHIHSREFNDDLQFGGVQEVLATDGSSDSICSIFFR